jgi:hypothetical protein
VEGERPVEGERLSLYYCYGEKHKVACRTK